LGPQVWGTILKVIWVSGPRQTDTTFPLIYIGILKQKSNNQVGPHKTFLKTILDIDINNDELKQCSTQKGHHLCAH
jgi:hypothetical protein